jgi:hypothetical protein
MRILKRRSDGAIPAQNPCAKGHILENWAKAAAKTEIRYLCHFGPNGFGPNEKVKVLDGLNILY